MTSAQLKHRAGKLREGMQSWGFGRQILHYIVQNKPLNHGKQHQPLLSRPESAV